MHLGARWGLDDDDDGNDKDHDIDNDSNDDAVIIYHDGNGADDAGGEDV